MKNIRSLFKINVATYFLILSFLLSGFIKNIIFIYLIVIVHELGHILLIKFYKENIVRVDIYPMGGVTTVDKKINTKISEELFIAMAGLLSQIVLGLIFFFIYKLRMISVSTYSLFVNYNKTIMLFNMLPIMPLDGYVIGRSLLEIIMPFKKSFYISFIISLIFIILFVTFNEFFSLNNYLIISFLIYKMIRQFKDFKFELLKFQLERYIMDIKYQKIKNEARIDLSLLKKDTYHFFKNKNTYIGEKQILHKKFGNNRC